MFFFFETTRSIEMFVNCSWDWEHNKNIVEIYPLHNRLFEWKAGFNQLDVPILIDLTKSQKEDFSLKKCMRHQELFWKIKNLQSIDDWSFWIDCVEIQKLSATDASEWSCFEERSGGSQWTVAHLWHLAPVAVVNPDCLVICLVSCWIILVVYQVKLALVFLWLIK